MRVSQGVRPPERSSGRFETGRGELLSIKILLRGILESQLM